MPFHILPLYTMKFIDISKDIDTIINDNLLVSNPE